MEMLTFLHRKFHTHLQSLFWGVSFLAPTAIKNREIVQAELIEFYKSKKDQNEDVAQVVKDLADSERDTGVSDEDIGVSYQDIDHQPVPALPGNALIIDDSRDTHLPLSFPRRPIQSQFYIGCFYTSGQGQM